MPIEPNDRYQQDAARMWRGGATAGRFPAQPPYRGNRNGAGTLSWHALNNLPAGSNLRRLNTHL
ncbi:DNA repair protein [Micromonospora sp. LOL_024]|uniref:DNA repair protein n=1 Tax=Micromonospora sp. LOL_024 TaxID=3345412 RepID=UPI003A894EF0